MNDRNRKTDTNEIDSRKQPLWYSGRYFDYPLFGIVLGLVLFGLVMVYSTSSYRADELYDDSTYFAKRQLVFELVALVGMFLVSKIDYRRYARYSKYFLYVAIALLVLVYIIGSASHGSTRWIYIGAYSRYLYQKTPKPEYDQGTCKDAPASAHNDRVDRDRELEYGDHLFWDRDDHCICSEPEELAFYIDGRSGNPDVCGIYRYSRIPCRSYPYLACSGEIR